MSQKINGQPMSTTYEFQFPQPKPKQTCAQIFYNPKEGTICGRTPASWAKILLFYLIFYAVLSGLFAICLKGLFATLNENEPKFKLHDSLIGTNPGLGYRPLSEDETERGSIIKFDITNKNDTTFWIKLIDKFLEPYHNKTKLINKGVNQQPCITSGPDPGHICSVNMTEELFGDCTQRNHYGYPQGKPCVFLKLNKIFGWRPDYYSKNDVADIMPQNLKNSINSPSTTDKVWVSCSGQTEYDEEIIGGIRYYPSQGFDSKYFPYENVPGYLSPLVAVQFLDPKPDTLIGIECRAWAKNIIYSGSLRDRKGSVTFQINMDVPNKNKDKKRE